MLTLKPVSYGSEKTRFRRNPQGFRRHRRKERTFGDRSSGLMAHYDLDTYLNVGTTIAITLLPTQLAKGEIVNPLGIFDSKYRRYMGEFFITMGLMVFPIFIGVLFMVIPGIVLSIAWTLSYYFLIEKGKNPIQAIKASNDATYGSKWTMFFVSLVAACCSASYSAFSRPSATRSASASSRSSSCSSSTCWPSRSQCPSALHSGNS